MHTRVRRLRTASSAQALDASAVRSGRSTPHACRERTTTVISALVQGPPGSSAEYTAQGARAPRAHGQQTAPAVQRTHRGCGAPWQCARARAPRHRRRLGHPHDASRPAAGACAHCGRGQAPSEARVRGRASARLARGRGGARTTGHWARVRTRRCHARVPRVAGSEGPAEAQAGQWSKPRTAREGEKLCVRTTGGPARCGRGPMCGVRCM